MNTVVKFTVLNIRNKEKYGSFRRYRTACTAADKVDDRYGTIVTVIRQEDCNGQLFTVCRPVPKHH